jgi:hypothetical protein
MIAMISFIAASRFFASPQGNIKNCAGFVLGIKQLISLEIFPKDRKFRGRRDEFMLNA